MTGLANRVRVLQIEPSAYRETNCRNKLLLTFDASEVRLKRDGFERHLRTREAFGLLIAGLEGKLSTEEQEINHDMLQSYGEWLSAAFERNGNTLTRYQDPTGLVLKNCIYVKDKFTSTNQKTFDITGIPSEKFVSLSRFPNDFVQDIYGRTYKKLPKQIQQAEIYLPPKKTIWPVGRGDFDDNYYVNAYYDFRASRGVTVGAKKTPRETTVEEKRVIKTPTFEQAFAIASKYSADVNREQLRADLKKLW